jgi:hypothetical protein
MGSRAGVHVRTGSSDLAWAGGLLDCTFPDGDFLGRFDLFLPVAVMLEGVLLNRIQQFG